LTLVCQAVQSAHSLIEYASKHPEVAGCTLVMLVVPDEDALNFWALKLEWSGVEVVRFHEPDLGNQFTAFAASDSCLTRRLSKLPLMLRGGEDNGREQLVAASESRCSKGGE
jgi:hypothetical protein